MLTLFNRSRKYVNLEIKDHVIRYTELKQGAEINVMKYGEYFLPDGIIRNGIIEDMETLKVILEQCVGEWRIAKREVCFTVPDNAVVMRKLSIEKNVRDEEIQGYLYLQLGTSIHLPFEEPVFDTVTLGEKDGQKEILMFAASDDVVDSYRRLLEECKLKPAVADVSALAVYRLYHALDLSERKGHLMVLQIDMHDVNASVFVDDQPAFMRHFQISAERQEWEQGNGEGMRSWAYGKGEDLYFSIMRDVYTEIEKMLKFYVDKVSEDAEPATDILLTGDHPYLDRIITEMKGRFDQPIRTIDQQIIGAQDGMQIDRSYNLPIGLGLRGGI